MNKVKKQIKPIVPISISTHIKLKKSNGYRSFKNSFDTLDRTNESMPYQALGVEELADEFKQREASSKCHYLYLNNPAIKGLIDSIITHTFGVDAGKAQLHTANQDWNIEAGKVLKKFIKDCKFTKNRVHLNKLLKSIFLSVCLDGDVLIYINKSTDKKIVIFEGNRIVSIKKDIYDSTAVENKFFDELDEKDSYGNKIKKPWIMRRGCLIDRFGRCRKYIVTNVVDKFSYNWDDVQTLDANDCVLYGNIPENNKFRGYPILLTVCDLANNVDKIKKATAETVRKHSKMALIIAQNDVGNEIEADANNYGINLENATDEEINTLKENAKRRYEDIDATMGGENWYVNKNDTITPFQYNTPPPNVTEFCKDTQMEIGNTFQMKQIFSWAAADKSFSAARMELTLTWKNIECMQKDIEREILDFVIPRVLQYAIEDGLLSKPDNEAFEEEIAYEWPTMPAIDEKKEAEANVIKLGSAQTTLSEILGSKWIAVLEQAAKEKRKMEALGLTYISPIFQTKSGGLIEPNTGVDNTEGLEE